MVNSVATKPSRANLSARRRRIFGRCEDIKNEVFDLVSQVHTDLFANSLKAFYNICGIKFQKNESKVQYDVKYLSQTTLSSPTETAFTVGKTALTMVQNGILDTKIKKFIDRDTMLE